MMRVKNIDDVVAYQLCTGCGVCASVEHDRYEMVDIADVGVRPKVKPGAPPESGMAFSACPGHLLRHESELGSKESSFSKCWGPVKEVWEGYASDDELRFNASSGGAASALAIFGIESGNQDRVLHIAPDEQKPFLNKTVLSNSREEIIARAGSRYAPSSPCEGLYGVSEVSEKTVFVGKPCDVVGAKSWEELSGKALGIRIGFFCAGVPSTLGNLSLLKRENIGPEQLTKLHYRGKGWPGLWRAETGSGVKAELSYEESWDYLQRYRQWRCYICPDHTGEFADISVGDPWYRPIEPGEPGKSLIIARTEKGVRYLRAAAAAGYLTLEMQDPSLLPRSQPNLMATRGNLWARLIVLRLLGAAVPKYVNFETFGFWLTSLNALEKISSFVGTFKRVFRRKLNKRMMHD